MIADGARGTCVENEVIRTVTIQPHFDKNAIINQLKWQGEARAVGVRAGSGNANRNDCEDEPRNSYSNRAKLHEDPPFIVRRHRLVFSSPWELLTQLGEQRLYRPPYRRLRVPGASCRSLTFRACDAVLTV